MILHRLLIGALFVTALALVALSFFTHDRMLALLLSVASMQCFLQMDLLTLKRAVRRLAERDEDLDE